MERSFLSERRKSKVVGWIVIVMGGWFLLSGVLTNDMGGIVALGYNPDVPMSFDRAPMRFILGILLYGAMIIVGIREVQGATRGE